MAESAPLFTSAMTLDQLGVSSIPQRYVLPLSQRPNPNPSICTAPPVIDLSSLRDQSLRCQTINEIQIACKEVGSFQVQVLLQENIKKGMQTLAVNCYPACPEPGLTLGIPPHSDYGSLTILLQTRPGLEIKDNNNNWTSVPYVEGALIVQLGDQMEVLSNGQYKSVIHRATVNAEEKRLSIASVHSFALEEKIGPAEDVVDEEHPKSRTKDFRIQALICQRLHHTRNCCSEAVSNLPSSKSHSLLVPVIYRNEG